MDKGLTHTWTFVNDTNFLFDKTPYVNMYEQDFTHTLDKVLEVTRRNTTATPAHDIWTLMFQKI